MKSARGWPDGEPFLDDLDGRARSDPDWTEPRRFTELPDGRVWCCPTIGWVSVADALDHSWDAPGEADDNEGMGP